MYGNIMGRMAAKSIAEDLKIIRREITKQSRAGSLDKEYSADCAHMASRLQMERADMKVAARHIHLCRMYVKGRKYKTVENKVKENNEPKAEKMSAFINEFGNPYFWNATQEDMEDRIKEWLDE